MTGEKVAVKILEKDKIRDSADIERVSREIRILKIVKHPNVISLYEIIETPKQLYLIMEYACGGELFDYIVARNRLKEHQACLFLQQLISGVEYLQSVGVVHRDLKPENLLLDEHNNLKIVDFGLSNLYKSEEVLKTACGSPCYAAPEMIAGKKYHGSKVDIWSCGVVLFAMVCGYLPFEDPNTSILYKKILGGEYKCGAWVSLDGQDLLKKILNTNPETRYTIDMIKNHTWFIKYCNKNYTPCSLDTKIDENIIKKVELLGLSSEVTKDSIAKNKHNKYTSTYLLLLKKQRNDEIAEKFNTKISMPQPPVYPRGDSNSINPRVKKIFEYKDTDDTVLKENDLTLDIPLGPNLELYYIKPTSRRKIYCNQRARPISTGYSNTKAVVPKEPTKPKPVSKQNFRPGHFRSPVSYNETFKSSARNYSPRSGTFIEVSMRK